MGEQQPAPIISAAQSKIEELAIAWQNSAREAAGQAAFHTALAASLKLIYEKTDK